MVFMRSKGMVTLVEQPKVKRKFVSGCFMIWSDKLSFNVNGMTTQVSMSMQCPPLITRFFIPLKKIKEI